MKKISILDLGVSNLFSILGLFNKIGYETKVIKSSKDFHGVDILVIPGVGAFPAAMQYLEKQNLVGKVKEHFLKEKPLIGICLGMQLLTNSSQEGKEKGLGLINAETLSFKNAFDKKEINERIPHMGWNDIHLEQQNKLTKNLIESSRFYFVHSYYVKCFSKENSLITSNYGFDFDSGIVKDNVYGVQFHPEKSHKYGKKLISNFIKL